MKCNNCHTRISEKYNYCPKCGVELQQKVEAPTEKDHVSIHVGSDILAAHKVLSPEEIMEKLVRIYPEHKYSSLVRVGNRYKVR